MTLLCVTQVCLLCVHSVFHAHIYTCTSEGFTHMTSGRAIRVALSALLYSSHLLHSPLHECSLGLYWSFYWGTFRVIPNKVTSNSFISASLYIWAGASTKNGDFWAKERKSAGYSLCEPPSTGSPGCRRVRAEVTLPAPYLRQCWGALLLLLLFCRKLAAVFYSDFSFTPHAEKLKPRFYQTGCDELWKYWDVNNSLRMTGTDSIHLQAEFSADLDNLECWVPRIQLDFLNRVQTHLGDTNILIR